MSVWNISRFLIQHKLIIPCSAIDFFLRDKRINPDFEIQYSNFIENCLGHIEG